MLQASIWESKLGVRMARKDRISSRKANNKKLMQRGSEIATTIHASIRSKERHIGDKLISQLVNSKRASRSDGTGTGITKVRLGNTVAIVAKKDKPYHPHKIITVYNSNWKQKSN